MHKVNFTLDDDVREELVRLIPARKRSRVVNEVLRKELLRRSRELAMERLMQLRKNTGTLSARDIVESVRKDRSRRG
jgi:Arc/MetJ family transcription regulator